jgi:hypothetical protein
MRGVRQDARSDSQNRIERLLPASDGVHTQKLGSTLTMERTKVGAGEEVAPVPGDLIESLRDFGYTLPSALADLVDNSLTAGATAVTISIDANGPRSHLAVVDNGSGMNQTTLVEAMRMGTRGPLPVRRDSDLGRFGLGLKTASLSQGKCLTVISKAAPGRVLVRRWDIAHVQRTGRWALLTEPSGVAAPFVSVIDRVISGTAVVVEDLDRATYLRVAAGDVATHFGRTLEAVKRHLAMVFHRFIEEGLTITLGTTPLEAWDPFLRRQSTKLATESLTLRDQSLEVIPYVLPPSGVLPLPL